MMRILPSLIVWTAALVLVGCPSTETSKETAKSKAPPSAAKQPAKTAEAPPPEPKTPPHRWNINEKGVVMQGHDPVAYHTGGKPVMGSAEFAYNWDGATFWFASAANQASFKADPEKYAPAVGGYCTFGIVIDKKLDGDPNVYWMNDEKLHLFLNEEVRSKFMQDPKGNSKMITSNWPKMRDRAPPGAP